MSEPHQPAPSSPLKRKRSETLQPRKPPTDKKSSFSMRMKRARSNLTEALFFSQPTAAKRKNSTDEEPQGVFGRLLEDVMKDQKATPSGIPEFLEQCIKLLHKDALDVQGIFRQSGSAGRIKHLKGLANEAHPDLVKDMEESDVHTIACALKQFLRELPDPLLTYELYSQYTQALETEDAKEQLDQVNEVLRQLPRHNALVLDQLINLLVEISKHSNVNLMTCGNLATVIGPAMLWSSTMQTEGAFAQLESIQLATKITQCLIENYDKLVALEELREKERLLQELAVVHNEDENESQKGEKEQDDQKVVKTPQKRTPLSKLAKAIRDEQIMSLVSPTIRRDASLALIQQSPILLQFEQENLTSPRAGTPKAHRTRSLSRIKIKPKVFADVRNLFDYSHTASPQKGPSPADTQS